MNRRREARELRQLYSQRRPEIRRALRSFEVVGRGTDKAWFRDLCFCLLAVQTKAAASDAAVRALDESGLLWRGNVDAIGRFLRRRVRFHRTKARWIVKARERFRRGRRWTLRADLTSRGGPFETREWLVREVDGLGYKEASHFLRNIGRGRGLAILDRHILRNLVRLGVLRRMPSSLSRRRYLDIEARVRVFARRVRIPPEELDLLLWSRETGRVFK